MQSLRLDRMPVWSVRVRVSKELAATMGMTFDEAREIAIANPGALVTRDATDEGFIVKFADVEIAVCARCYKLWTTLKRCEDELVKSHQEREEFRKALGERVKEYLLLQDEFYALYAKYTELTEPDKPDGPEPQGEYELPIDLKNKLEQMAEESGQGSIYATTDGQ
jgi:hypothetical protein